MNLYVLTRPPGSRAGYDNYLGAAVLAESAREARQIAADSDRSEYSQTGVFLDPSLMRIRKVRLDRPRVVLTSYLHG